MWSGFVIESVSKAIQILPFVIARICRIRSNLKNKRSDPLSSHFVFFGLLRRFAPRNDDFVVWVAALPAVAPRNDGLRFFIIVDFRF